MKIVIVIFICLLFFPGKNLSAQNTDTIYWSKELRLKFTDFQGYPLSVSPNDAVSSISIDFEYTQFMISKKIKRVKVYCYFNKKQSWLKKQDFDLLHHEQMHFNIAEIFARKFRKKLSEAFDEKKLLAYDEVQQLFLEMRVLYEEQVKSYDEETDHSKDKRRQLDWNTKVQQDLLLLNRFDQER